MKAEEGKFKKEFGSLLEMLGCHVHITHGNQYQAGMPDMHITSRYGYFLFIECKFWSNVNFPSKAEQVIAQLKGAQINVITNEHWKRNASSLIASVIGINTDIVAVCYKDRLTLVRECDLARHVTQAKNHLGLIDGIFNRLID